MFKSTLFFLILLSSLPLATSASAVTVFFGKEQGAVNSGIYSYEDSLKIVSYEPEGAVVQSEFGLGIDDPHIDNEEGMSLYFSAPVNNLILTLENWDPAKDTLLAGTPETGQMCFGFCPLRILTAINTGENGVFQFSGAITELTFGVPGYADETATSLLSASWDDGSPSVVPLPAALPLYAAGMGLMGLMGWRKRRKPAP